MFCVTKGTPWESQSLWSNSIQRSTRSQKSPCENQKKGNKFLRKKVINNSKLEKALKRAGLVSTFRTVYSARLQERASNKCTLTGPLKWHCVWYPFKCNYFCQSKSFWDVTYLFFLRGPLVSKLFVYNAANHYCLLCNATNIPLICDLFNA